MELTAAELARRVGGIVEGDGARIVRGVAGIRNARETDVTFINSSRYASRAAVTQAAAVVVPRDWNHLCSATLIRVENPNVAFASIAELFTPPSPVLRPGIHETAVIGKHVHLGEAVYIGPYCIIKDHARVGDRTILHGHCYIGHHSVIGADGLIYPHVSMRERIQIGDRVIIHNGAVIGSDGFGYTVDENHVRHKIPQIGRVIIGDDVEIGAHVTIDRARFGATSIGHRVKIDNQVQIAHNVSIGEDAVLIGQVGIAGSTIIGKRAILAGQAGIAGHLVIGDDAIVGAQAGVTKNVPDDTFVFGSPAAPHNETARLHAYMNRLPEFKRRIEELERQLARIKK